MLELNIVLNNQEVKDLSKSINDSIDSLVDFLSSGSTAKDEEFSKSAYSLYVLSKLYNFLPKSFDKEDSISDFI